MNKKERTRRTIRRQAIHLTLERGFDGFTMQDLAEASELSRSSIFNHFTDKVGAVLGVTVDGDLEMERNLASLMELPRAQTPVEDAVQIITGVLSTLELDAEAKETHRLMLLAMTREPKLEQAFTAGTSHIIAWISGNLRERFNGEISESDCTLVGTTLNALLFRAVNSFIASEDPTVTLTSVLQDEVADLRRLLS